MAVKAGGETVKQVTLRRWVDMPARGWYSGDMHVHYARADEQANRRLIEWTADEDIHVASVLRMGDAKETYFEQYGFGKEGRYAAGDYALAPGQEDPRTNVIGHTLQLNLQRPVRVPDRYYLYDLVFDNVHRQGGLTGYAHVYQPAGSAFYVRRDMALNVPARRVDFAEISEFGDIGEDLYYEFLEPGLSADRGRGQRRALGQHHRHVARLRLYRRALQPGCLVRRARGGAYVRHHRRHAGVHGERADSGVGDRGEAGRCAAH